MDTKTKNVPRILPARLITFTLDSMNRLTSLFIALKLTPNRITILALLIGIGAGILFAVEQPVWAAVLIVFCGVFDIMDGKVAVKSHKQSKFGAIFDSTLDRYSEFFIYLGLAVHFRNNWALWVVFITFLGSAMVSYTRARAEGLGIACHVGIMQRAERMILIVLGSLLGTLFRVFNPVIIGVLVFIAVVSHVTALQRTFYVRKVENTKF